MTDAAPGEQTTLFPQSVGERLRAAREVRELSLAEIAARTRVPLRHLEAIENGAYGSLPSPTYFVGFARAYARAVGEDEVAVAHDAREESVRLGRPSRQYQPYEIADPARVPSRGLVIVAAGIGLAIIVLAILWFASGLGNRSDAPDTPPPAVAVPVPVAQSARPAAPAAAAPAGQVTLTATGEVWLRVFDADDTTLFLGTMKPGDHFDVPADAKQPKITVGRPDMLKVTLNGAALPPLGTGERPIKNVPVDAAALAARAAGQPAIGQPATRQPAAAPSAPPSPEAPARPVARARPASSDADGTARANLRSPEPSPTATISSGTTNP